MSRVAALLLAAGRSRRMGCCKQLLPLGGETVLARCLSTIEKGGVQQVVVVLPPGDEALAQEAARFPVRLAWNPEPDGDMASSIRAGRDHLGIDLAGVLVALCDYPLVRPDTVAALLLAQSSRPEAVLVPYHHRRRGHPIMVPRDLLEQLVPGLTLRDLVQRAPERLEEVVVDDPGILLDMDTPEQYRQLQELLQKGAAGAPGP